MKYRFKLQTAIPLTLDGFDLAATAQLELGTVTIDPTGEMNDEQIANAQSSITAAVAATLGVTPDSVELLAIQS